MSDLITNTRMLAELTDEIVRDIDDLDPNTVELDQLFIVKEVIAAAKAALLGASQDLDTKLGDLIGLDFIDVLGKRWSRHGRYSNRNGQNDDLLRAVLDSRLVDPETGEVIEETPTDKIKAVWNLPVAQARKTALEARHIDVSQFIERRRVGWTVSLDR